MNRFLFLIILSIPTLSFAADFGTLRDAEYIRCYDGDTCRFNIPGVHSIIGSNVSTRLDGIDTPEIRGKCSKEKALARKARESINHLFKTLGPGDRIDLTGLDRGKYFRLVTTILIRKQDGSTINVNRQMIEKGFAVPYDGGKKTHNWCR